LSWSKCWIGSGACRCLFVAAVLCWVGWVRYRYVCVRVRGAASTYVLYGRVLSAATRVGRDDPCSLAFARLLLGRENLCCDNFVFFLARDREHFCSGNFVHCVSRDRFGTNVEIETGCSVPCVFCRFPHVTPCELSRVVVTSGHSTFGNRGPKLGKVKHNFSGNRSGPWLHNETPQLWENWSLHTYLPPDSLAYCNISCI
jgi:hypothetical protein